MNERVSEMPAGQSGHALGICPVCPVTWRDMSRTVPHVPLSNNVELNSRIANQVAIVVDLKTVGLLKAISCSQKGFPLGFASVARVVRVVSLTPAFDIHAKKCSAVPYAMLKSSFLVGPERERITWTGADGT